MYRIRVISQSTFFCNFLAILAAVDKTKIKEYAKFVKILSPMPKIKQGDYQYYKKYKEINDYENHRNDGKTLYFFL